MLGFCVTVLVQEWEAFRRVCLITSCSLPSYSHAQGCRRTTRRTAYGRTLKSWKAVVNWKVSVTRYPSTSDSSNSSHSSLLRYYIPYYPNSATTCSLIPRLDLKHEFVRRNLKRPDLDLHTLAVRTMSLHTDHVLAKVLLLILQRVCLDHLLHLQVAPRQHSL